MQLWECNGFESQQWLFEAGTRNIKYAKEPSKCIDVPSTETGQKLWLWDCDGSDKRRFGYDANARAIYAASSSDASLCVDVPGGNPENGALLQSVGVRSASLGKRPRLRPAERSLEHTLYSYLDRPPPTRSYPILIATFTVFTAISPVAPRVPGGLCPPGVPRGAPGGGGPDGCKDSESSC